MASKKTGHHPQHQATFAIKRSLPQQIEQRRERGRMKPWKNTMNTYIPFEKQNRKHREQIEIEAFNRWNTFPWIFVTGQHAVSGASGAHQDPGMKFEHTQRGMLWYLGWVRNDAETWGANASHETSPGDNAFFLAQIAGKQFDIAQRLGAQHLWTSKAIQWHLLKHRKRNLASCPRRRPRWPFNYWDDRIQKKYISKVIFDIGQSGLQQLKIQAGSGRAAKQVSRPLVLFGLGTGLRLSLSRRRRVFLIGEWKKHTVTIWVWINTY